MNFLRNPQQALECYQKSYTLFEQLGFSKEMKTTADNIKKVKNILGGQSRTQIPQMKMPGFQIPNFSNKIPKKALHDVKSSPTSQMVEQLTGHVVKWLSKLPEK